MGKTTGIKLNITEYLNHSISDIHKPIFADKTRLLVVYGGAGSGKSHAIAEKMLYRMLKEPSDKKPFKLLIVRKVAKTLLNSVWELMLLKISAWGISNLCKINKTHKQITINGNIIIMTGLDDVEKLKSIEGISSIWIEEASELEQGDLDQLDLRLRGKFSPHYKQIILSFNPIHIDHWIKKTLVDDAENRGVSVYKSTYLDNKHIDDEYKAVFDRLKQTNRIYYNIYALGEWGVYKGIIFERWEQVDCIPREPTGGWDYIGVGIDFGFNVASAVVQIYIKGKMLFVDELIYKREQTNSDLIRLMKISTPPLHGVIHADSAEPDRIMEINRAGFKCYGADKANKLDRINFVKSFDIRVTRRSTNIIKELHTFVWAEDRLGNQLDEPVKMNDHAMDAMMYSVYTQFKPVLPLASFDQSQLGF